MLYFLVGYISFYNKTLTFVQFLLIFVISQNFSKLELNFAIFPVSLYRDHRKKCDSATHDGIAPLSWNNQNSIY